MGRTPKKVVWDEVGEEFISLPEMSTYLGKSHFTVYKWFHEFGLHTVYEMEFRRDNHEMFKTIKKLPYERDKNGYILGIFDRGKTCYRKNFTEKCKHCIAMITSVGEHRRMPEICKSATFEGCKNYDGEDVEPIRKFDDIMVHNVDSINETFKWYLKV